MRKRPVKNPRLPRPRGLVSTEEFAAYLRSVPTRAEKAMGQLLKGFRGRFQFDRQVPVGCYVVDFYCREANLAIEVDGDCPAHADKEREAARDDALFAIRGCRVLHFTNAEVFRAPKKVLSRVRSEVFHIPDIEMAAEDNPHVDPVA